MGSAVEGPNGSHPLLEWKDGTWPIIRVTFGRSSVWRRRVVSRRRRVVLTEEGGLLYERGIGVLADFDEAEAQVSARISAPQGRPSRVGNASASGYLFRAGIRAPGARNDGLPS